MATQARGQGPPSKQERNRSFVEAFHPPEPEPDPDLAVDPAQEYQEFVARLLSQKAGHVELIRALHGPDPE